VKPRKMNVREMTPWERGARTGPGIAGVGEEDARIDLGWPDIADRGRADGGRGLFEGDDAASQFFRPNDVGRAPDGAWRCLWRRDDSGYFG